MDIIIPNPPNVEIRRKPIDEQLTHVLDNIPSPEPENNEDFVIFSLEFLMTFGQKASDTEYSYLFKNLDSLLNNFFNSIGTSGKTFSASFTSFAQKK